MLGNIIDKLPDDAKDRLIRAARWDATGRGMQGEARCFVGHVHGDEEWAGYTLPIEAPQHDLIGVEAACRFDKLCHRFGKERVVRAIKQRAGWTPPEKLTSEPVERSEALVPA